MADLVYGTAWKEERTARLVRLALDQGFRAIDTANQRKHYHEAQVGEAIAHLPRASLFVQTKFTFVEGQDARLPYDREAPIAEQVAQSFASSLVHLGTDYLDAYLLHGPQRRVGLAAADWDAWNAMELLHSTGKARALGVSNVSLDQLQTLHAKARVKPAFVQNRCDATHGWDSAIRTFCAAHSIRYQGFSLLTANPQAIAAARPIAARLHATPEQVVLRFAVHVGMLALTGTSSATHMQDDLAAMHLTLSEEDVRTLGG